MAGGRSVVVGGKGPRELVERGGGEGRGGAETVKGRAAKQRAKGVPRN